MALASAARTLWAGLAAAVLLAILWRLTGAASAAIASAGVLAAAAGGGIILGLRRRDLLAAAAELDQSARLEAALATGLEVSTGRVAGPLAGAALGEAQRAASGLGGKQGEQVGAEGGDPLAPLVPLVPRGARYLAVPAAVLAGVALLPGGGDRRGNGVFVLTSGHAAQAREGGDAARTKEEPGKIDGRRFLAPRARLPEALEEYKERRARDGGRAYLPAPPRGARRRPARDDGSGASSRGADGGGDGDASGVAAEDGPASLGGAEAGPVDRREAAIIQERFPEYEELVRRYFAGPQAEGSGS
jgi:hypothetical protein